MIGVGINIWQQSGGEAVVQTITATLTPATSALVVGQSLDDTPNWAAFLNTANYASSEGTIVSAIPDFTGASVGDATTAFADLDTNRFAIVVTDDQGNVRTFRATSRTVVHVAPVAGTLAPVNETQGSGTPTVNLAAGFTGQALVYTSNQAWATVSGSTLTIADEVRTGTVRITANNSSNQPAFVDLSVTIALPAIGTAPSIADGQAWIIDDGNAGIDASASGAGLTFEYAISGVPAGVTINTSTGLIDPNPTGIGSVGTGTATVTATDQFSRPITDTFTWSAALRPKAVVEGGIVLSFTEGVSFDPINLAFPITNGNTITYSIVGTQLPAAFSLSSGGILTEVSPPTVMADTAYILRGIDEYGYELSDTLNIEVLEISTVIAVNLAGDGTVNITRGDTGDFTITVSGSSTPSYNGTFTQDINGNPLNTALVEANAAIWFAPPVQTALTAIGSTHTLEAVGLYLFDGDAAAPTITTDWQNAGLSLGDTDATYVSQVTDGGDAITNAVTATRAGVTTTTAISNTIVVDAAPVAGSIFFSDNGNGTSTMDAFTPLAITLTDNGDGTSTTGGL